MKFLKNALEYTRTYARIIGSSETTTTIDFIKDFYKIIRFENPEIRSNSTHFVKRGQVESVKDEFLRRECLCFF